MRTISKVEAKVPISVEGQDLSKEPNKPLHSSKGRNYLKIANIGFLAPTMFVLIIFVFIPLFFSLYMSLYNNPSISNLTNVWEYYRKFTNMAAVTIRDFFISRPTAQYPYAKYGLFSDQGVYSFFTMIFFFLFLRIIYKQFSKRTKLSKLVILPISTLIGLMCAGAIMLIIIIIVRNIAFIGNIPVPLKNYRSVFTDADLDFMRILFNTLFWTIACTLFHVILGIGLAVLLNRKFPGRNAIRGVIILPWAIPSFVSTLVWRSLVFDPKTGFLGRKTADISPSMVYSFTISELISLIGAILLGVLLLFLIFRFGINKIRIHRSVKALLNFTIILLIIALIWFLNIYFNQIFAPDWLSYKIVDIPKISASFWYVDDIFIFGMKFKTITFSAILVNVWLGVPFMMVSFSASLQSIPLDLYEAADIDGASNWQKFKKITFPLLVPTLTTVSLLGFIWTFNLFNVVYILTQNQNGLGNGIYYQIFVTFIYDRFSATNNPQYAEAAAMSFTVFLMLVSFSVLYRKLLTSKKQFESVGEK